MNTQTSTATSATAPGAVEAAHDLVLACTARVPPQLEHWLRKRGMRLQQNETPTWDPADIRASGARSIVVDLDDLPAGRDPVEAVRALRHALPDVKMVALTHRGEGAFTRALTEAGVAGVVVKQPYVADLVFALQAATEGRQFVTGVASDRERAAVQITAREREVLELMANGHSNQAIGERLSISVKTVEAHRARLFKKLGASNVADAVLLAIRTGLVMP
jgi:DNA-binding NarL/FixJ family response regulator